MSVSEVESTTPTTNKRASHLLHVDAIPDDAIAVTEYGPHEFDNLYYSPSSNALYQQYPKRIRMIETGSDEHGKKKRSYVRSKDKKTIYVSLKKILKQLGLESSAKEESSSEDSETHDGTKGTSKRMKERKKAAGNGKIEYVKKGRKKLQTQVGEITNAQTALSAAKATKRKGNSVTVKPEDIKL